MRIASNSFLALIASGAVFAACRKEPSPPALSGNADHVPGIVKAGDGSDCREGVRIVCGMLYFNSAAQYQEVYDCLEAAYDAHIDAFEAQWGHLSEDDYNDMADLLGFVDEQALINFETSMGVVSYRSWFDGLLQTWMDGYGDPELFPHQNLFGSPVAGALHNQHGAVMIAGRIHLVDPLGRRWEFCSCQEYQAYLANPSAYENIEEDDCVEKPKTTYQGYGVTCRDHWKNCWWEDIGNSRKVNQTLSFYYGPPANIGWTEAMAEMRAFKKVWGKWRLRRIKMRVLVHGQDRLPTCAIRGPFDRHKGFRWCRRIYRIHGWQTHRTFVDNEVKGQYWYTSWSNFHSRQLQHTYNGCY